MKHLLTIAAMLQLTLLSCKKESDTQSSTPSSFTFQLSTVNRTTTISRVNSESIIGRTVAANLQWTAGTATASELKFEAMNASGEVEFKQRVTQQINLFSAASTLGSVSIPPGTYTEVDFKAQLVSSGNVPALELSGQFTSGGIIKPVIFRVNNSVELKAEKNNVTIAAGTNYTALNTIDLSILIAGITEAMLNSATISNGTIIISSASNSNMYNIILNNLARHHEAEVEHH